MVFYFKVANQFTIVDTKSEPSEGRGSLLEKSLGFGDRGLLGLLVVSETPQRSKLRNPYDIDSPTPRGQP
jgi:hypothetical protein